MKRIVSRDNPTFKHLRALADDARYRREQQATILDGIHLIQTAISHAVPIRRIAVTPDALAHPEITMIVEAMPPSSCEFLELSESLLRAISPVDSPRGIVAEIDIPSALSTRDKTDVIVLAGIQDVGNLGTLLRTASAAGIKRAWLSNDCTHAWSPKVLRAGMGAHFLMTIEEQLDLDARLKDYDGQIIATALRPEAADLFSLDLALPTAWLFGSEGQGLPQQLLARANHIALIPMPGDAESLNVAASAAVCLFEQVRQRRLTSPQGSHISKGKTE